MYDAVPELPLPDIRILERHALPIPTLESRLASFSELLGKYGIRLDWQPAGPSRRAPLRGVPGIGGHIEIRPSEIEILVQISRMITMMGLDPTRLESTIRRHLGDALRP